MGTAYELPAHKAQQGRSRGAQRFFYLDPPLSVEDPWDRGESADVELVSYVVVSTANVPLGGPETYIFRADPTGQITNWGELPGSFRGGLDHLAALGYAGYGEVIDGTTVPEVMRSQMQAVDQLAVKELEQ